MTRSKIDTRPNPYEVFGIRKTKILPEHFEITVVPYPDKPYPSRPKGLIEHDIETWILENTHGRYFLLRTHHEGYIVGFEEPKELSYFILAYK